MSSAIKNPIRENFATFENFQRISHVGPKIVCPIITLETLQTFLSAMFDAETLAMLDFSRNVGFFGFEGGMWDLIALIPDHCFLLTLPYILLQLVQYELEGEARL